jgi:hypothetical protein
MEENKTGIFKLPVLFHFYNAGEKSLVNSFLTSLLQLAA